MRSVIFGAIGAAICTILPIASAQAETSRGVGTVALLKDQNSTRTMALIEAKRDVVRSLLINVIGEENISQVPQEHVSRLADQIFSSNIITTIPNVIIDGKSKQYRLEIEVDVDGAWLTKQIKNFRITLPSQRSGVKGARIMLLLDSFVGIATDSSKPLSEVVEYSKEVGSSFSDKSIDAYSERERAASSQSQKSAASARSSSAAAYRDRFGAAAGSSRSSGSAASSSKSAAAYSKSIDAVSRADVESGSYDNTYFRSEVIYQGGNGESGSAKAAADKLAFELGGYDITLEPPKGELDQVGVQRFEELNGGALEQFLANVSSKGINYVFGGKLTISKIGYDDESRQFRCSGELNITPYSTISNAVSMNGNSESALASGADEQGCQSRVAEILAKKLADNLGPRIMENWRDLSRDAVDARDAQVRLAAEGGEYNLVFRSPTFNIQTMQLITSTLNQLDSIKKPFPPPTRGEQQVVYRVNYKSIDGQDLGMAVLVSLADKNPALADSPLPTIDGQSVTVCLVACP